MEVTGEIEEENGRDRKGLCNRRLSRPDKVEMKDAEDERGKNGRDGKEGAVCLGKTYPPCRKKTGKVGKKFLTAGNKNCL